MDLTEKKFEALYLAPKEYNKQPQYSLLDTKTKLLAEKNDASNFSKSTMDLLKNTQNWSRRYKLSVKL